MASRCEFNAHDTHTLDGALKRSCVATFEGKVAVIDGSARGGFQLAVRSRLITSYTVRTDRVRVEFLRCVTGATMHWNAARPEITLMLVRNKVCHARLAIARQIPICITPGSANFWLFPEGLDARGELNCKQAYDCAGIFVDPSFLPPAVRRTLTEPKAGVADETFSRAFDILADEMTGPNEILPLFAEGWVMQALACVARAARPIQRSCVPSKGTLAPWQLRRATEMLRSDLSETPAVLRVAEACRLSASQFGRAFRASTGLPPHRWLMRERILVAQDLLLRSPTPLSEIALICGFADQSHFSRVFRLVMGTSPGAWRREHCTSKPESISRLAGNRVDEAERRVAVVVQ